jgi:single-strand DNA-binding protein
MNSWNGIGRLTKDPELVETAGGTEICNLRIAIDRRKKDEGAVFLDVKAFGAQAAACATYLEKGRQVSVSGRLELDEWDAKDGSGKRSRLYVIGERIQFLARPGRDNDEADTDPGSVPESAAVPGGEEVPS